jgi:hypothetical protein
MKNVIAAFRQELFFNLDFTLSAEIDATGSKDHEKSK